MTDDVERRLDSVHDLAAGQAWLIRQPGIDPARVAVMGQSYGGYMVLAAITEYPALWRCAIDFYGIADFATLLEATGPWRKAHRAAEYGDPVRHRALFDRISPIHHAGRIQAPLLGSAWRAGSARGDRRERAGRRGAAGRGMRPWSTKCSTMPGTGLCARRTRRGSIGRSPGSSPGICDAAVVERAGSAGAVHAVLGRQRRDGAGGGQPGAATAFHPAALERGLADRVALRLAASARGCVGVAGAVVDSGDAGGAGGRDLQQPGVSRPARHDRGERAAAEFRDATDDPGRRLRAVRRAARGAADGGDPGLDRWRRRDRGGGLGWRRCGTCGSTRGTSWFCWRSSATRSIPTSCDRGRRCIISAC